MSAARHVLVGVFGTRAQADRTRRDLLDGGVHERDIAVHAPAS